MSPCKTPVFAALLLAAASLSIVAPADAQLRKMGWEDTGDLDHDSDPSCSNLPPQSTLVVSFVAPPGVTDLTAISGYIDFCTVPYSLPPFWKFSPLAGGCRSDALSVSIDFSNGPFTHADALAGAGNVFHTFGAAPTWDWSSARIDVGIQKSDGAPIALQEGQEYYAFKVVFENPPAGCEGCEYPACFVLNGLLLYHDGSITPTVMDGYANYVRWHGGQFDCPFVVATEPTTWSRVKAIYR